LSSIIWLQIHISDQALHKAASNGQFFIGWILFRLLFPHDAEICSSLATKPVLQKQTSDVVVDALEHDILHEVQTF
jgi:hypothetical protein